MTTTERNIVSMLVAWCPDCLYHTQALELGQACDVFASSDCPRKLIKRRLWICQECSCSYRLKADADAHECRECY